MDKSSKLVPTLRSLLNISSHREEVGKLLLALSMLKELELF